MLALSLVARPIAAQEKTLTAQQVLDAAAQKYAGFYEFQGTCSILLDGESSIEGEPPTHLVSSANSAIKFVNGQTLTVTGDNGFGSKFEALSTPTAASISIVDGNGKKTPLVQQGALDEKNTEGFLAGLTGVSGGGGATLPALLLSDSALNPLRAAGKVELQPMRNFGTTPCYVLTRTNDEAKSVTTMWIEQSSFLLRRLEVEFGETKAPELTPADLAKYPQLKDMPKITTHYVNHTLIFATQLAK